MKKIKKIDIKKISKVKILIALLVIAAVVFGIYNILWFRHIAIMNEIVNNEKLQEIKNTPSEAPENFTTASGVEYVGYHYSRYSYEEYEGWIYHDFRDWDYNEGGQGKYSYYVALPPYLRFAGGIDVHSEKDDYSITLRTNFSLSGWEYVMSMSEISRDGAHATASSRGSLYIDKDGYVLEHQPQYDKTNTDRYGEALAFFEKYNEPIMEMMTTVNEMFGDILR